MTEQGTEQGSTPLTSTSAVDAVDIAVDAGVAAVLVGGSEGGDAKPFDAAALPAHCHNCGAPIRGRYCVDCGQDAATHVPTLPELLGDYISGLLNLDSRIWRTLRALVFKPGLLTQEYLAGKRARYILPLRLYIAMSIVFFLVAALPEPDGDPAADSGTAPDFNAMLQDLGDPRTPEEIQQQVLQQVSPELREQVRQELAAGLAEAEAARLAAGEDGEEPEPCLVDMPLESVEARVRQVCLDGQADNYADLKRAFQDNIALMAFLVIPVMAAVFKLFYLSSGRGYLEHLAFLCHTHALTLLLFAVLDLVADIGNYVWWLKWLLGTLLFMLAVVYLPTYYFLALRRVYGQSRTMTLVKLLPLLLIYMAVAALVFAIGMLVLVFAL